MTILEIFQLSVDLHEIGKKKVKEIYMRSLLR